jgi:outer membrane protein OmpA-like peptidoglycan-associated protein
MRQPAAWVVLIAGGFILGSGCATKQFVREEVQRSEGALGQEMGRVETGLGQERTRLGEVAAQVTETRTVATAAARQAEAATGAATQATARAEAAAGSAGQAMGRADEALAAAGQAGAKAEETDRRLTRLWAGRQRRSLSDTVVVVFGFDRWQLDDRAQTTLRDVVRQLQAAPDLVVDLEGYTDNVGPATYNLQLSQRRAEAVRRFLVDQGVELHRIQSIGLGDTRPIADNTTRTGREQNRRVALKLWAPIE